jgi:hypothetical protein
VKEMFMGVIKYRVGRCGLDSSGSGYILVAGSCEHVCTKCGEFMDYLSDY